MEPEDDQQLWDLLGRSAAPKLSPFFARNVVRKFREEPDRLGWVRAWFRPRRLIAASAAAIAIVAMAIGTHEFLPRQTMEREPDSIAKIDPQDYDVVADLDQLSSWDENSLWEEKPTL